MGKLKDMVAEDTSVRNRIKYNARRFRLAGIGLISKVDEERTRLYKQLVEAADDRQADAGLVAKLNALSVGAFNLVREESQRLFDELVEAGEQATAKRGAPVAKTAKDVAKPVAQPSKPVLVKSAAKPAKPDQPIKSAKPAKPSQPAKPTQTAASQAPVDPALQTAFEQAKARLGSLTAPPDQATQLNLYALYKQAVEGDVKGRRPALAKVVERAKYDARHARRGMTQAAAMQAYINLVGELTPA